MTPSTRPGVIFSPAGGTFKTETLTVSVSLTPASVSGWYQVAGQQKVNITSGNTSTFTIGAGMSFGESISVTYGATSQSGDTTTGTVTYKKVDPTASITVYVDGPQGTNMYAWGKNGVGTTVSPCGEWPGKALSETVNVNGTDYYYVNIRRHGVCQHHPQQGRQTRPATSRASPRTPSSNMTETPPSPR